MSLFQHEIPDIEQDFDLEYLTMVSGGDKTAMLEFYNLLETSTEPLIDEAIISASANDWASTAAHLHKLKGQLGILTMNGTISMVIEMEHVAKNEAVSREGMLPLLQVLKEKIPLALTKVKARIDAT